MRRRCEASLSPSLCSNSLSLPQEVVIPQRVHLGSTLQCHYGLADAGMDMASASGGEQAVSIDQRQQAWQNGPETAGQSTNGKAVLQDSDTLHLRGDDSGAASPLQVHLWTAML